MGSILSTTLKTSPPLSMSGTAVISGEASFAQANPPLSIGMNSKIAGQSPTDPGFADVINTGVTTVDFPLVNTADFMKYVPAATAPSSTPGVIATNNPSGTYFKNIRIKANSNPIFAANTTIEGIIVVEKPNQVKFGGSTTIRGASCRKRRT